MEGAAEATRVVRARGLTGRPPEQSIDIQLVHRIDRAAWAGFVEERESGNIFHTPEMFDALSRAEGYRPHLWAAVDARERPLALLVPVEISLMGGPLRYLTTRAVAFGSVLTVPGERGRDAVSMLLEAYSRQVSRRVMFTELRNLADVLELRPVLQERGFEFDDHLNFLIDVARPLEAIWGDVHTNARRNIRKAMRSGVLVREGETPGDVTAAYGVLRQAYARIQVPLPSSSLFHATFELLGPRGMVKVLLAEIRGVVMGALTLLMYKGVAIYWYTGSLREYSAYRPADLLVWRSLELAHRSGCRVFDFGGAGNPRIPYGVRDFKAKFGGRLVNFGRHTSIHAPTRFKLAQAGYRARRRMF